MDVLKPRITVHRSKKKLSKIIKVIFLSFAFMAGLFIYATNEHEDNDSVNQLKKENDCDYEVSTFDQLKMSKIQTERNYSVFNVCEEVRQEFQAEIPKLDHLINTKKNNLNYLVVDDEHRLLYCFVPKVASTNWLKFLIKAAGKVDSASDILRPHNATLYFRRLNNYTDDEIRYRLTNYTKFMFVRHPIERLVSAFRDKFENNDPVYDSWFIKSYGRRIIKRYRPNASNESLVRGHDVTFKEFVQYLNDLPPVPREADLCHPCNIKYDVIGKYETLKDDTWAVMSKADITHLAHLFPSFCSHNKSITHSKTKNLIETYTNQLSKEEMTRLFQLYALDHRMFTYSKNCFLNSLF